MLFPLTQQIAANRIPFGASEFNCSEFNDELASFETACCGSSGVGDGDGDGDVDGGTVVSIISRPIFPFESL